MNKTARVTPYTPVAIWILIGVGMLIIQVILGGVTRLTGSGLSITEWDLVTGILPPLNSDQWLEEFSKYKQTSQYRLLNIDFDLSDFKSIFFWEWFHRFWAYLIALVFIIPFIVFLIQRRFQHNMVRPLLILFLLGALQGAVGWIMVQSGLTGDAVFVKPTKLAMHFVLACTLISYAFWFGLQLNIQKESRVSDPGLKKFTLIVITILVIQLVFGALMAGLKAAAAAPTWPDINGTFYPESVAGIHSLGTLAENPVGLHFIHRMLAYFLVVLVIAWTIRSLNTTATPVFKKARLIPLLLVITQLFLGILAVLTSTGISPGEWKSFEWIAVSHQLMAIFLLLSLVAALFLLHKKQTLISPQGLEPKAI